jgi:hypothetical protein
MTRPTCFFKSVGDHRNERDLLYLNIYPNSWNRHNYLSQIIFAEATVKTNASKNRYILRGGRLKPTTTWNQCLKVGLDHGAPGEDRVRIIFENKRRYIKNYIFVVYTNICISYKDNPHYKKLSMCHSPLSTTLFPTKYHTHHLPLSSIKAYSCHSISYMQ